MKAESPLRPRELVPLLALAAHPEVSASWTQAELAQRCGQAPSQIHHTLRRTAKAGLYSAERQVVRRRELLDFLRYGVRHAFFAELGPLREGVPTAAACPALSGSFVQPAQPWVWPSERGSAFGPAVEPLHASVPDVALVDEELWRLLALVDCIRLGGARERSLGFELLAQRLDSGVAQS